MHQAFLARRPAIWRPLSRFPRGNVHERDLSWLFDSSSLTQRVAAVCPGCFRVQVLSLDWKRPLPDECRRLELREGALALVRQVQLLCDDRPLVFARTVIPRATLSGRNRRLAYLGCRPLGAALFADPTMQREPVEVTQLVHGDTLFALATHGLACVSSEIWGRRSVFRISGKPLLVSEIFLSDIPNAPCR